MLFIVKVIALKDQSNWYTNTNKQPPPKKKTRKKPDVINKKSMLTSDASLIDFGLTIVGLGRSTFHIWIYLEIFLWKPLCKYSNDLICNITKQTAYYNVDTTVNREIFPSVLCSPLSSSLQAGEYKTKWI